MVRIYLGQHGRDRRHYWAEAADPTEEQKAAAVGIFARGIARRLVEQALAEVLAAPTEKAGESSEERAPAPTRGKNTAGRAKKGNAGD